MGFVFAAVAVPFPRSRVKWDYVDICFCQKHCKGKGNAKGNGKCEGKGKGHRQGQGQGQGAQARARGTGEGKRGGASPDKVTDLDGSERVGYAVAVYCRCIVSVCFASHREADSNQSVVARNIRHLRRHRNRRHQSLQ